MTMRALLCLAFLGSALPAVVRAEGPDAQVIVGFKEGIGREAQQAAIRESGLLPVEELKEINAWIAQAAPSKVQPASAKLMANAFFLGIEEDPYFIWLVDGPAAPPPLPGTGSFLKGAPLGINGAATQGEVPWGIARVRAPQAWDAAKPKTQGEGVRVAVVDTGIDCAHPDLAPNCVKGDGVNIQDPAKPPLDDQGHGTHVSGTIAAAWDGKGVVGVAPRASLVPVKVLDARGGGRISQIVKGILWCANNNIQVANMSLGAPIGSLFMRGALLYAKHKGTVVVAAAGNSGGSVGFPAAYDDTIAVAASDSRDDIAYFSSRGAEVEIIAPGVDVYSSVPGGGYERHSGTSMATPHVAGLAALAVARGARGKSAVWAMLKQSAAPLPNLTGKEQGVGMADAVKILSATP